MEPTAKRPGQGGPDDCSWDVAGSPRDLLLPLPRGPHEEGAPAEGGGGPLQKKPLCIKGAASSQPHSSAPPPPRPPSCTHPCSSGGPLLPGWPPRSPCLQGPRVKQVEWARGKGLAWPPCLKDRSSTAHFLPQERWQRLGIMDDPSLTSPLHPSRPLPAAGGGAFLGLHPHPAMQAGAKTGSYFRGRHLVLSTSNGRGDLCAPPLPHPHPVSSNNAWQWHPGSGPSAPSPSLEGGGFGYSPVSGSCSRWQQVETDRTVSLEWGGGQRGKV